jgi:hypothetical protein
MLFMADNLAIIESSDFVGTGITIAIVDVAGWEVATLDVAGTYFRIKQYYSFAALVIIAFRYSMKDSKFIRVAGGLIEVGVI